MSTQTQNIAPPATPADPSVTPPVTATVSIPDPAVITAAVEKARKEEKDKLYGRLEEDKRARADAEKRSKDLEAELAKAKESTMTPDQKLSAQLAEMAEAQKAIQVQLNEERAARIQAELRSKREQVLREHNVPSVVAHLVVGNDQGTLEAAARVALTEYTQLEEHFKNKFVPVQAAPAQQPAGAQLVAMPVQASIPAGNVAPTLTSPAPAPATGVSGMSEADFKRITSPEGIRSGEYQRRRAEVHQYLQQGGASQPSQTQMRPMQQPTQQPQQQFVTPYQTTAPVSAQTYVRNPDGSFSPVGMATPAAQVPGYAPPQAQPSALMPPAPAPGGSDMMIVNGVPMSLADVRAAAASAGQAALQNPSQAAARAGVPGTRAPVDYQLGQQGSAPPASVLVSGSNPMIRG